MDRFIEYLCTHMHFIRTHTCLTSNRSFKRNEFKQSNVKARYEIGKKTE